MAGGVPRFLHGNPPAVGRTYKGGHRSASPQKRRMQQRTAVKLPMSLISPVTFCRSQALSADYHVRAATWPLARSLAGQAVEGLPGAALGGLGVAGAHPGRREVGPRLGEPLLEVADLRLQAGPRPPRPSAAAAAGRATSPFGFLVLLPAPGRPLGRLPRQPLVPLRLPPRVPRRRPCAVPGGRAARRAAATRARRPVGGPRCGPAAARRAARGRALALACPRRHRPGRGGRAGAGAPRQPRQAPRRRPRVRRRQRRSPTTAPPGSAFPRRSPPRPRGPPARR